MHLHKGPHKSLQVSVMCLQVINCCGLWAKLSRAHKDETGRKQNGFFVLSLDAAASFLLWFFCLFIIIIIYFCGTSLYGLDLSDVCWTLLVLMTFQQVVTVTQMVWDLTTSSEFPNFPNAWFRAVEGKYLLQVSSLEQNRSVWAEFFFMPQCRQQSELEAYWFRL